jgi:putative transposase
MLCYRRKLPHWIPDDAVIFITWRLAWQHTSPLWLQDPRVARMVENALRYGEAARGLYSLYAWVIMPNHVHVVFEPKAPLPGIMCWLKGRTSRAANRILGRTGIPFWQDESYDHWIRSNRELHEVIAYVENNPVNARLVEAAGEFPWSSARFRTEK